MNDRITLHRGDCLVILPTLAECSIDACVTDPPYHLTANKNGGSGEASLNLNSPAGRSRIGTGGGFMGKKWDGGDIAFCPEVWREVYRVLKPGAHLLAFGGTRTYHRMACAIEDARFEIRDCIQWLYGSGFPKSHSVSVAVDKMNGVGPRGKAFNMKGRGERAEELDANGREFPPPYEPATASARQWEGWGTALKPACELIVLARKPLSEATVAANVLMESSNERKPRRRSERQRRGTSGGLDAMKRAEDMTDREVAQWAHDEILQLQRLVDRQREEIVRLRKAIYGFCAPPAWLRQRWSGCRPELKIIGGTDAEV